MFNGAFSVRKCVVKRKEKIMFTSYGETSGFSAVGAEELMLVNGGKGGGKLLFTAVISQRSFHSLLSQIIFGASL